MRRGTRPVFARLTLRARGGQAGEREPRDRSHALGGPRHVPRPAGDAPSAGRVGRVPGPAAAEGDAGVPRCRRTPAAGRALRQDARARGGPVGGAASGPVPGLRPRPAGVRGQPALQGRGAECLPGAGWGCRARPRPAQGAGALRRPRGAAAVAAPRGRMPATGARARGGGAGRRRRDGRRAASQHCVRSAGAPAGCRPLRWCPRARGAARTEAPRPDPAARGGRSAGGVPGGDAPLPGQPALQRLRAGGARRGRGRRRAAPPGRRAARPAADVRRRGGPAGGLGGRRCLSWHLAERRGAHVARVAPFDSQGGDVSGGPQTGASGRRDGARPGSASQLRRGAPGVWS
mmetsp:Transcript_62462/g.193454  ORF Transcript_62462/g.193454 Transcript_62462/m.193454 type:complete len:347 (+) Transcript_62462:501-1541(+)